MRVDRIGGFSMKLHHRFQFRLTFYIILLALLPLLIAQIITFSIVRQELESDIYRQNAVVVEGIKTTISQRMNGVEAILKSFAKTDGLTSMEPDMMANQLLEMVNENVIISQMYVTDDSGMQIYKTSGELGDRSTRGYFQKAMTGEANYSNVIISGSTNKPIIVYAVPIYNGETIVGTLGASIELSFISDLMASIDVGEDGYGFIVDAEGVVVAHPDKSLVENKVDLSDLPPVQAVKRKEDGSGEYLSEGEEKLASYSYLALTDWGVLVQLPKRVAFAAISQLMSVSLIVIIVAALVTIIAAAVVSRSVTIPISHIESKIQMAKNGNLNIQLDGKITRRKDEFGRLSRNFSEMIDAIRSLISNTKNVVDEVNTVATHLSDMSEQTRVLSNEITNAVDEIAKGAGEQAEESEKSAELSGAFNDKFKQLESQSTQMNENVVEVMNINEVSKEKMTLLKSASHLSGQKTDEVQSSIEELEKKSVSIADILETITSISEQTNLLALNASIEAARAGEHGKGFAVVADEIRKLAEGSSEAAGEIGDIINSIQNDIRTTVGLMKEVSDTSKVQGESVNEVNKAFTNINDSVQDISDAIEEIGNYVNQLSHDNVRIVDSVNTISAVSQQTAAASEEVTASVAEQLNSVEQVAAESKELKALAKTLKEEIEAFEI